MDAQPLHTLKSGQKGVIVALGADVLVRTRLIERGIMRGCQITIVCNSDHRNPLMLAIDDLRLAVEQDIARQIQVVPLHRQGEGRRWGSGWLSSFCCGKWAWKKHQHRHRHRHRGRDRNHHGEENV